MSTLNNPYYVPFLKGKAGEFAALADLDREQKDGLRPLIDVPPERVQFWNEDVVREGQRVKQKSFQIETVDQALSGYAAKVCDAWGKVDECLIDLAGFDPSLRLFDGTHPVTAFFNDAQAVGLAAVPVTGLDRDDAQVEAVREVCRAWPPLGVAIRVRRPALQNAAALVTGLPELLEQLEVAADQVDLLLDFGELLKSDVEQTEASARALIATLPELEKWKSIVLCSGAFPSSVGRFIKKNETGERPRRDWDLWQRVVSSEDPPARLPTFGDYGATRADWGSPFDFTEMSISAKIIYAGNHDWVIVKGERIGAELEPQYYDLSRRLEAQPAFLGKGHCSSEDKVIGCRPPNGPGNTKEWVTAAVRHHIEVVSRQLASLP
jgi:hypothetical protein